MKHNMKNLLMAAFVAVAALGFTACSDDDKFSGEPYFTIEGLENNTYTFTYSGLDTTAYTSAKKFVVRSNRPWRVEAQNENGWSRVFPTQGELDGIIRLSSSENVSPATREVVYKVYLDGEEYTTFTVRQTGAEPYIRPSANNITIGRKGGETQFSVIANVDYEMSILPTQEGEDTGWITVTPAAEAGSVVLTCGLNPVSESRSVTLHIQGKGEYSDLFIDVPVTQLGALFFENFSWMNHSDTSILGWVTDGESNSRYDKWTEEELSHGWESRCDLAYGRPGFLKLGKTSYGGDLISPKIAEIQGTMNITVSAQFVGYSSASGTLDDRQVYVGVIGPGKIVAFSGGEGGEIVNGVPYIDNHYKAAYNVIGLNNVASFVLPSGVHFNPTTDPTGLLVWENPNSHYSFDIDGATNETRIVIIAGAFYDQLTNIGKGKNRIFVDNFKVEER